VIALSDGKTLLIDVTTRPNAAKYELYRWCDYVELRCLTHKDKRFSRDGLTEALGESRKIAANVGDDAEDADVMDHLGEVAGEADPPVEDDDRPVAELDDAEELLSTQTFRQLAWRARAFGATWPFEIDAGAREIRLKPDRDDAQVLYLQMLLSSMLRYCAVKRRHELTGPFEYVALHVFSSLMPQSAQVHRFGAGRGEAFAGALYDKLVELARAVRGTLLLERRDFPKNDVGDGGLDLVAWHELADQRNHIPVALGQCGCTVSGWPTKALEASPARLHNQLHTGHRWATYYFMPLDLTDEVDGKMGWQQRRDLGDAIYVDRLRVVRLANPAYLRANGALTEGLVREAVAMELV
jgi:hypothetical protein